MSQFLPETQQPAQDSGVSFAPPASDSSGDIALMQRVLSAAVQNPSMIPADFLAYVVDYIQTQRLQIPIGQVVGFQNFVSTQASVYQNSGQSLSGTFANGASASGAGPSVSVPSGKYVVLAGGDMATQFGNGQATLTVSPGGMVVRASAASTTSAGKATGLTMSSAGTISSTLFVAGDGSPTNVTSTISGAWLVAIRYDNA